MGAKGDGVTDDTPAIQAAISLAQSHGGGIVTVPAGTYLLNSYYPSPHPWFFHNLIVGSNVLIQGTPGARFLQGPGGRAPLQPGAYQVRNSVVVVGTPNYTITTFQNTAYNGGFLNLQPTTAGNAFVTLASPSQAQTFVAGDYVAVYSATSGDVIPSETSQVTSVNYSTGTLNLNWALARSFSTAYIAKVTSLATSNVGLTNLVVQGTETLAVMETYNLTVENCAFVNDTSIGGSNVVGLDANTVRDFRFSRDQFSSIGPSPVQIQLPQRNSQTGVVEASNFIVDSLVFGEYAAHWNLTANNITVNPVLGGEGAGVAIGGLDVTFANNTVNGSGPYSVLADYVGDDSYVPYIGDIAITGNSISCSAPNNSCVQLGSLNPVLMDNVISATGNTQGVLVQGPMPIAASIAQNSIVIQNSTGIVLNTYYTDASSIIGNTISGAGEYGVLVTPLSTPDIGGDLITGNCVSGFTTPVYVATASHPGTLVSNTSSTCSNPVLGMAASNRLEAVERPAVRH